MKFDLCTQAKTEAQIERFTARRDGVTQIVRSGTKMLVRVKRSA